MIKLIMDKDGVKAHIRDRHVTWCGTPGDDAIPEPSSPHVCQHCIRIILSDGDATSEEIAAILKSRGVH